MSERSGHVWQQDRYPYQLCILRRSDGGCDCAVYNRVSQSATVTPCVIWLSRSFSSLNGKQICMNVYDVRLTDDWPACGMNWPPDLPDLYAYLRVSSHASPSDRNIANSSSSRKRL